MGFSTFIAQLLAHYLPVQHPLWAAAQGQGRPSVLS